MIKTNPWKGGSEEEYETQHFGFGAQRFQISVRQMIEHKITRGVKDMESYLEKSLHLNETDKTTLTHSCDKLIRMYCERAVHSINNIDREIERILKIPSNVVLPGDEVQLQSISGEDYKKLKDEVNNLRRRVERGALMEALLTAEEDEIVSFEKVCETAKKDMEVLDLLNKHIDENNDIKTIQNNTQFLCASVPFMKNCCKIDVFEECNKNSN